MKRREIGCVVKFKETTLRELKENGYIPYSGDVYIKREQYMKISNFNRQNNIDIFPSFIQLLNGAFDNGTVSIDKEHLIYLEILDIIKKEKINFDLFDLVLIYY